MGDEQTLRVVEHMHKTLNIVFPRGKSAKNPHLENIWLGLTVFEGLGGFLHVTSFE